MKYKHIIRESVFAPAKFAIFGRNLKKSYKIKKKRFILRILGIDNIDKT